MINCVCVLCVDVGRMPKKKVETAAAVTYGLLCDQSTFFRARARTLDRSFVWFCCCCCVFSCVWYLFANCGDAIGFDDKQYWFSVVCWWWATHIICHIALDDFMFHEQQQQLSNVPLASSAAIVSFAKRQNTQSQAKIIRRLFSYTREFQSWTNNRAQW